MNNKIIGAIFLVTGTAIGGGMLALPVTTAQAGFIPAVAVLLLSWLLMTTAALLIVEVNLWLPKENNLVSMAGLTLGRPGKVVAWLSCLLLLYALISAYIAGGSDIFANLLHLINIKLPGPLNDIIFTVLFGFIVFKGMKSVDYVNRGLISIKLGVLTLLFIVILPHVTLPHLEHHQVAYLPHTLAIVITSFGFANIVPSLCHYLDRDAKQIRIAVLFGSLLPLGCYIVWIGVVLGSLPLSGEHSLMSVFHSSHTTSSLTNAISNSLQTTSIKTFTRIFTSICVATSFLGVSLALSDFIADGVGREKQGLGNLLIYSLTFIPPLVLVIFWPGAFMHCLEYAGILCVILLMLLPALMAYSGRYIKRFDHGHLVPGGKLLLIALALCALLIIYLSL